MIKETTGAANEVLKTVPPVAVTTITYVGLSLQEWVYVVTLCYTGIQIYKINR